MNALPLFDGLPATTTPLSLSSPALPKAEQQRFNADALRLLARLRTGPLRNTELHDSQAYGLNPTARVSDLRKAGYDVENFDRNRTTGESWYRLNSEPQE